MSFLLYPRIYPLTQLPDMLKSDDPESFYQNQDNGYWVKPSCIPCFQTTKTCQEVLLIDDGEHLTILVGSNVGDS
jgi:hypothetical protein